MPTRVLKRQWCRTCQDYTIHNTKKLFDKEWFCESCDTEYIKTDISEIPEEKLLEQRKRWSEKNKRDFGNIYTSMILGTDLTSIFNSPLYNTGFETEIKEDDAGQNKINEELRREKELEYEKQYRIRHEQLELKKKYKNLGRNDKCICGSDLKYKNCCLTKISKIR
jgi:hypothetical protein